ncbi:hypothetical protein [Pseudofrankia sp. DC12]|uniref:hypothetical protein n=1 Tax=Pseudofrankia sp. DC12 TaxID=683315 RepID=UPI0006981C64|nr:hypothetical protein [Pseudofrankia sp. DC12]
MSQPPPGRAATTRRTDQRGTAADGVEIDVAAGRWTLRGASEGDDGFRFTAELTDRGGRPLWAATRPDLATLEEALGWAVPIGVQDMLNDAALRAVPSPPGDGGGRYPPIEEAVGVSSYRPERASEVRVPDEPPVSYGSLIHAEPTARRWRPGPVELDLFGLQSDDGAAVLYRMSETTVPGRPPTVVLTGVVTGLPTPESVRSDDAIHTVARHLALRAVADDSLTGRQHGFLHRHSHLLAAAALDPPDHPYPRGTRIAVHDGDPTRTATGTVLAVVDGPTGPDYLWRPDIADLAGHPWQHHPTWALRAANHDAQATLATPDTGVDGPRGAVIQATGALVTPLDDPRFATGTVLRALLDAGPDLAYEIQPLDAALPPIVLDALTVVPLRAAAWPTLDDLLAARTAADLPVLDGEVLATRHEWAMAAVVDGETHLIKAPAGIAMARAAPDPTDDATPTPVPAGLHRTAGPSPTASGRHTPTLRQDGDVIQVDDPTHGRLVVSATAFHTAMRCPGAELTAMLARRPWLPTGEGRPLFVVAALAAQHAADDRGLLTPAPTPGTAPNSPRTAGPDSPAPPQPNPAGAPAIPPENHPPFDPGL